MLTFGIGRTNWWKQKKAKNTQLDDKEIYQQLRGDVEGSLDKVITKVIMKLRNQHDISHETLDYFSVNNSKLGRFYS